MGKESRLRAILAYEFNQKHTPEPWFVGSKWEDGKQAIFAENLDTVAYAAEYGPQSENPEAQLANARRIVACVNACEGIDTVELERGELLKLMDAAHRDIKQQRDELLEALTAALQAKTGDWQNGSGWEKKARAAIAKATG